MTDFPHIFPCLMFTHSDWVRQPREEGRAQVI